MQQQIPDSPALRGLTSAEADARAAQGLTNRQSDPGGKSAGEIIRSNTLTFFNLIFAVIAVLLCLVGSYRNLTFLPSETLSSASSRSCAPSGFWTK